VQRTGRCVVNVLERVRRLIALSGSPNEEEARSAAFIACKLIREHGIAIGHSAPCLRTGITWIGTVGFAVYSTRCTVCRGPIPRGAHVVLGRMIQAFECGSCFLDFLLEDQP
jgi:hypothetical protein